MDDPRPLLLRAADQIGALVTPDTPLDAPTPCEGWSTDDLLAHLVTVHRRIAHIGRGGAPFDVPQSIPQEDAAAYAEAFAGGRKEIAEVWGTDDDAVLDREVTVPWGTVPGRVAAWGYVRELAAHAWDLALALDRVGELDPAIAEPVVAFAAQMLPAEPRGGPIPFGPVVPVPDDAGPYERLVGWLGRDPGAGRP